MQPNLTKQPFKQIDLSFFLPLFIYIYMHLFLESYISTFQPMHQIETASILADESQAPCNLPSGRYPRGGTTNLRSLRGRGVVRLSIGSRSTRIWITKHVRPTFHHLLKHLGCVHVGVFGRGHGAQKHLCTLGSLEADGNTAV